MTPKETIAAYLDDANRETGGWVAGAIAALTLASAAIFVLTTYDLAPQWRLFLQIANGVILVVFAVEYGLRVWTAEHWWHYVFSVYGGIDLIAILPLGLGLLQWRGVQGLQWLRVLRLSRLLSDRALIARVTAADTLVILRIVFTIVGIVFVYAGIIFQVEEYYQPDTFETFLDAAYFAVVTITTVGYGDIAPVSDAGRLCTMLMILTGIALIPTQLSDLIRRILKMSSSVQILCDGCGWSMHDPDAQFCKRCGTALAKGPMSQAVRMNNAVAIAEPPDSVSSNSEADVNAVSTAASEPPASQSSQNPA